MHKGLADKTEGPGPSAKKGKGLIGEPGYLARHGRPSVVRCANIDPVQLQPWPHRITKTNEKVGHLTG